MMLKEILIEKAISLELSAPDKDAVVEELANVICDAYGLDIRDKVIENIQNREKLGSTGMGQGIAIPHCKIEGLEDIYLAIGIHKEGVDFKALDGEPVYIFFILIAPSSEAGPHLKALARISRLLRDEYFCRSLRNSESQESVFKIVVTDDEKI